MTLTRILANIQSIECIKTLMESQMSILVIYFSESYVHKNSSDCIFLLSS